MTSHHKDKSHHSSLFSVFQRKKRQTSAPIAPHNHSPQLQQHDERPTSSRDNIENHQPLEGKKSALPPLSFAQRLKLHKHPKRHEDEFFNNGPLKTSQSQTLATKPSSKHKHKKDSSASKRNKAYSTDAVNDLADPDFLIEALMAIGDDQPTVARSIPKHAVISNNPRKTDEKLRKNCIFQPEIYEKMLADSLLVCNLLEDHLIDCEKTVRAQSPLVGKKPAVSTGSFQEFLITATAPSTPSRSPATDHRSPLTISSASMSPLLLSSSPSPSLYRQQKFLVDQECRTPKKDLIYVR